MISKNLKKDIDRVRDEIKDLFRGLAKDHPDVVFTARVESITTQTPSGKTQTFDVVVTTIHGDDV